MSERLPRRRVLVPLIAAAIALGALGYAIIGGWVRADAEEERADQAVTGIEEACAQVERMGGTCKVDPDEFEGNQGPAGKPGDDGTDGSDGADGSPGSPGADGKDGQNGGAGVDGQPGSQGEPGPQGESGPPGKDGEDGEDGKDAPRGKLECRDGKLVEVFDDGSEQVYPIACVPAPN